MWDTIIGGLLVMAGGLLALGGNYWIETRRWKREDRVRYHDDRHRAYTDFYGAASAFATKAWTDIHDELPNYIEQDTKQLALDLMRLEPQIEMIASTPVRQAARRVTGEIRAHDFQVREQGGHITLNELEEHARAIGGYAHEFAEAARRELGVALDTEPV